MEKSHTRPLLKQSHSEEELGICISALLKYERVLVMVRGASPDGPKLMRKSMGSQAKNLSFLLIISRN